MTKCIKTVLLALTSIVFLVSCDEDELTEAQFENLGELVKNTIFVA